jgi:hypothetical protein
VIQQLVVSQSTVSEPPGWVCYLAPHPPAITGEAGGCRAGPYLIVDALVPHGELVHATDQQAAVQDHDEDAPRMRELAQRLAVVAQDPVEGPPVQKPGQLVQHEDPQVVTVAFPGEVSRVSPRPV